MTGRGECPRWIARKFGGERKSYPQFRNSAGKLEYGIPLPRATKTEKKITPWILWYNEYGDYLDQTSEDDQHLAARGLAYDGYCDLRGEDEKIIGESECHVPAVFDKILMNQFHAYCQQGDDGEIIYVVDKSIVDGGKEYYNAEGEKIGEKPLFWKPVRKFKPRK